MRSAIHRMTTTLASHFNSPAALTRLATDAGWMSIAEAVNRVTRILTAIALAYAFSIEEFGFAAAVLTVHELTRALIQNGLGTRIVTATDSEVGETTSAVNTLNWALGGFIFVLQIAIAWPVAAHLGQPELATAIVALAAVHVIYPFAMVRVYLAQRASRWRLVSAAIAAQAACDNLLTAGLALAGLGIWAVVIPKLLVALGWVIFHRRMTGWTRDEDASRSTYRRLVVFASRILSVEILSCLRAHGDKALVGAILGPTALGLYAFAANIGKGITLSLSASLGAVILPYMRRAHDSGDEQNGRTTAMLVMLLSTAPLALGLAATAHWLIPAVFGQKWAAASSLVALLALGSLAQPILVAASQMLRAANRTLEDVAIGVVVTVGYFASLWIGLSIDLSTAVLASVLAQSVIAIAVFFYVMTDRQTPRMAHTTQVAAA